jgi:hypothetical protein
LAGVLSGSGSSRGALPNVFLDESFSIKSRGARAVLEKSQIMALFKTALAPLEEPLSRSRAKHPLKGHLSPLEIELKR